MNEIEQAIETIENYAPDRSDWEAMRNAVIVVMPALRTEAEREKGCEWCHRFINKELQLSNVAWVTVSYCPNCGKRLEGKQDE